MISSLASSLLPLLPLPVVSALLERASRAELVSDVRVQRRPLAPSGLPQPVTVERELHCVQISDEEFANQ